MTQRDNLRLCFYFKIALRGLRYVDHPVSTSNPDQVFINVEGNGYYQFHSNILPKDWRKRIERAIKVTTATHNHTSVITESVVSLFNVRELEPMLCGDDDANKGVYYKFHYTEPWMEYVIAKTNEVNPRIGIVHNISKL